MTNKLMLRSVAILLGVAAVTAALCAWLYRVDNKYTHTGDTGLNGMAIWDGDGPDNLFFLARGWEFYQHKLLAPEDFTESGVVPDAYVFIGQYGGFEMGDPAADPHGSATYRIRVSLPETPRSYAIELPEVYSACRLYVNGELLAQRGDLDPASYRPMIQSGVYTFRAGGEAEIIVAATDYSHFYSGLVYPPAFGEPQTVSAMAGRRLMLRMAFCSLSLLAGIVFLVGGFRTGAPLTVGYGLTCLLFVGYTCYPIVHAIGWGGPLLWYRIENCCYCLVFLMVLILQSRLCGVSGPVFRLVSIYGGGMCLAAAFPGEFIRSLPGMLLYSRLIGIYKLIVIGYLLGTILYVTIKKALNPQLQLIGITAFGVCLIMDRLLPMFEPIATGWFPELGGAALMACLGGAICVKTARAGQEVLSLHLELYQMEESAGYMDRQLVLQSERLESLRQDMDETRRSKHDLRHHMLLLHQILNESPEQARVYLRELDATLPAEEEALCKNLTVDCVVRQYAATARREGITVETAVDLPAKMTIPDPELCVVFSNLLENALEALRGISSGDRVIRVTAGLVGNVLAVNVENSLHKLLRYRRGVLYSSKREAPGVGISSVRSLAEKHGGALEFQAIDNVFRVSVTMMVSEQVVV